MRWLVRQGSSSLTHTQKTLLLTPLSSLSKLIHSTVTHLLLTCDTATKHPPIFNLLKTKLRHGTHLVKKTSHVGESVTSVALRLSPRQLHNLLTQMPLKNFTIALNQGLKGEVRTLNDRNICERKSCMKNNGKSPTFKFVSGEERRPSEVQKVSWGWRLRGATHSSADLTWIWKWLEIQAPELSELESVELELGSCCSDLDKQVSGEICPTRKRQFEIPFRL